VDRTGDKETVGIPVVNANAAWDAAMPDVLKNIGPGVSTTKPELSKLLTTDTARSSKRLLAQGAAAQGSKNRPASSTSSATTLSGDPRAASKGTSSSPQANSSGNGNAAPVTPENLLNTPPTAFGPPAGIGNTPDVSQPATGEIGRPPNLPPTQIKQDQVWMQSQFDIMNKRYLIGEAIALSLPQPSQLMSLGATLPPIKLEANYTQPISLKDSLLYSLDNNLAIRIANANKSAQKWLTVGQFGGFLPNVIMNFQHQFLKGSSLIGGVIPSVFDTPNTTAQAGFQMFGFQGGSVLFGSLSQLHQFRAAREQLHGTINDTLLAVTRAYYNLVQNQVLLQIQTRAVEVARAQVLLNQQLESAGTGTKFQVLQSDTQLALNEQNLLGQEVALRNSAIDLATTMNLNAAVNFLSVETEIRKVRLVDPSLDINTLISLAVLNRPELRQYEQLRIAARRNIQLSSAGLYPQFQFFGSINGNGATLTKSYVTTQPSFTTVAVDSPPTSTSIVSPNGNISSLSDAIVPPGGKQTTANGKAGTSNTRTLVGAAEQFVPPQVQSRQMRKSYTIGVRVDWNYNNLGVPTASNIWAAKALARQALLNSNQQLLNVLQQVRESYLLSQTAEREIEVTTKAVISATEELRLAQVRLANGVGTNIDVINAQRDFVTALVNKAQAIIQFNIAQAQLLHDMGLITVDTLTSGRLVKRESN
jgi:outer membrane protein TolC